MTENEFKTLLSKIDFEETREEIMNLPEVKELLEQMLKVNEWKNGDYNSAEISSNDNEAGLSGILGVTKLKHPGEFWVCLSLDGHDDDNTLIAEGHNRHFHVDEDTTFEDLEELFEDVFKFAMIELGKAYKVFVNVA